jgi:polynucleotide 5'-hydroxyl-kinase GRC3/NOL9
MTDHIPGAWAELAERLADAPWRRLVVLGATDVGKSSFCRFLGGMLAQQGERVGLLDTDLGQKMIGPPACVTLGSWSADGDLQLDRIRFVGEASPAANMAGVIAASARLANAATCDRLIVNTSGLVHGPGVALKRWKLDALDPCQVVAIARAGELEPVLAPLPRVHRLRPSPEARRKSPAVRERNRRLALLAALGDCRAVAVPGAVVEELRRTSPPPEQLRLCGLADADGEDRGIGLVRGCDLAERGEVWSSLDPVTVRRLRLGMVLSELGEVPGPFQARG